MTSSLDPHNPREYRRRAAGAELLSCLALVGGIVGLVNRAELGESILARQLGSVAQTVWLGLYAAGGLITLVGLYWPRIPRPELEGLGLWLLIGGLSINLLVLVVIRGPVPDGASITTIAAIVVSIRVAYRRELDLERARITERREVDLGHRARSDGEPARDKGRRRGDGAP